MAANGCTASARIASPELIAPCAFFPANALGSLQLQIPIFSDSSLKLQTIIGFVLPNKLKPSILLVRSQWALRVLLRKYAGFTQCFFSNHPMQHEPSLVCYLLLFNVLLGVLANVAPALGSWSAMPRMTDLGPLRNAGVPYPNSSYAPRRLSRSDASPLYVSAPLRTTHRHCRIPTLLHSLGSMTSLQGGTRGPARFEAAEKEGQHDRSGLFEQFGRPPCFSLCNRCVSCILSRPTMLILILILHMG